MGSDHQKIIALMKREYKQSAISDIQWPMMHITLFDPYVCLSDSFADDQTLHSRQVLQLWMNPGKVSKPNAR